MASVTAEVLLWFGTDDEQLKESVDILRFGYNIEDSEAIIQILSPAFRAGYAQGCEDSY